MSPESDVRLTIPAEAPYLSVCRAALSGFLTNAGDDEVEESKLVLSEVCAAAVAHQSGEALEIAFRAVPGAIEVEVTGAGVDAFLTDPVAHEVVDRLASGWRVERAPDGGSVGHLLAPAPLSRFRRPRQGTVSERPILASATVVRWYGSRWHGARRR